MTIDSYFDMRNLTLPKGAPRGCPVTGCTAPLGEVAIGWKGKKMPYCPEHRIRIHSNTFVYYNGRDAISKREAALQNILFERPYFKEHILENPAKAETHRICNENSEDALTWNVFSRLARAGLLPKLLSTLTHLDVKSEPELYLWGLRVHLDNPSAPSLRFKDLEGAQEVFEAGIKNFLTEPDIMLHVPGQLLVLVEAKFTSGNTIALASTAHDVGDAKPKSREGVLRRYPHDALLAPPSSGPFYSQLYRNLVFANYMANKLKVRWGLVSLVGRKQFDQRDHKVEFQDPTQFIHALLPEKSRDQFLYYSWERLYADHVAKAPGLYDLGEYMCNKSANGTKALAV